MLNELKLAFDIEFKDLYDRDGLIKLDQKFCEFLKAQDVALFNKFVSLRSDHAALSDKDHSDLIIEVAVFLDEFTVKLFNIEAEAANLKARHTDIANIFSVKRLFIQRQAVKKHKEAEAIKYDGQHLRAQLEKLFNANFSEDNFANFVTLISADKEKYQNEILIAEQYAAWAVYNIEGQEYHKNDVLFKLPKKLDFMDLVPCETVIENGIVIKKLPHHHTRYRDGFKLTDEGGTLKQVLDHTNYCIYCHNQGKDSCSKGLKEKDGTFKKSIFGVQQAGCPLEEKISEMNLLKSNAVSLGALAVIAIDNPLCAATGHRICNDCMKSCIYQKQEPVNIPRNETGILQDVLNLPYGFEIYSLFTRWNPLNLARPIIKANSNYKILVAGLGPAGFNLSHHLLNEGHLVVAIDGLKIEPVNPQISGVDKDGNRVEFKPVKYIKSIFEPLDERVLAGFGGVAEYGITVRWNKNYLKIIRLLLERRQNFSMHGGVRFGSTITYYDVKNLGFDHVALALGAGRPTILDIPNAVSRGVRTASDFLMSLQLTGAAKKTSIANLQLRLPVLVIGGGLTAVDTVTESLAYYPIQVEKFLSRYEKLSAKLGENIVRSNWSREETIIAEEFITHAKAIRAEKQKAAAENRVPDILALLNEWGGAVIIYRKKIQDSPAYRLNHEEIELAMQEGLQIYEEATPLAVELDEFSHVKGLKVRIHNNLSENPVEKTLAAKAIFMAAGTNPNTVLNKEDPQHFELDGRYFRTIDINGDYIKPEYGCPKPKTPEVLMHKSADDKYISFFGDLHPSYVGNVVKAMGAAKQGYPVINKVLIKAQPYNNDSYADFSAKINAQLSAKIYEVRRLTPNIVEVTVKAPLAARNFKPGQFYRFQNYEEYSAKIEKDNIKTSLAMEGLALTGAWVDKDKGLLSTIVLEMGGSSNLCDQLKINEPVVLMGPTGTPTFIPKDETIMLVGGGLGNAVLFSIGKAMRDNGCKVLYFAGYKKAQDRYKVQEIIDAADKIVWACDESIFTPERPQDKAFHGNIVQAIKAYGDNKLGDQDIKLNKIDRVIAIGSDRMMNAVNIALQGELKSMFKANIETIGSINSPMQCMMKEICAQCLQRHIDHETGEEYYVYSCLNQDQELNKVDFDHLNSRLKQNSLQEKLTAKWLEHVLLN